MVRLRSATGDWATEVYRHTLEDLRKCNDAALRRSSKDPGDLVVIADVESRDNDGQTLVDVKQKTSGSVHDAELVACTKSALESELLHLVDAHVELALVFEEKAPDVTVHGKPVRLVTLDDVEAALRDAGARDITRTEAKGGLDRGLRIALTYKGKRVLVAFSPAKSGPRSVYIPALGPYHWWRDNNFTVTVYPEKEAVLGGLFEDEPNTSPGGNLLAELLDKIVVVR